MLQFMERDTRGSEYAQRLERLESARWKRILDVQRPYRWNLRRLTLGRVLEVGCGIGRNLEALPAAVGVDHNADSVKIARGRGFLAYSTDEWDICPEAEPATFDSLLLAHVLEHMDSAEADDVIGSYLPYLKPAAKLLLICPQERGYRTDVTHVRFLDFAQMAAHARTAGFSPVREYSFPFPRAFGKVFPYNEFVVLGRRGEDAAS